MPVYLTRVDRPAQTAFVDGPWLAVRDGLIVAREPEHVAELIGPSTEVVNLAGRALIPGFVDAHVHPFWAGLEMGRCNLLGLPSRAETLAAVRAYADEHPDREWITGAGWSKNHFPDGLPHRSDLDAVTGGRPAVLLDNSHHSAWANTTALQQAGIDAHTPDPPGGRIGRDPDGTPSGNLFETASELVGQLVPPYTADELADGLLRGQAHLHSLGIVGWQDAIVGTYLGQPDSFDTYVRLAADGRLTGRVRGALWWDRTRGLDQLDDLRERRKQSTGNFRATSVKIMQDGVAETFTAAMLAPYLNACGCRTGNSGTSFIDPDELKQAVRALDADGWQVHVHALGDRAVRESLDALEGSDPANRHHLAHLQVVHPEDVPRFAALGVSANLQALWACNDHAMRELTVPFLGPERSAWQYPFAAIATAGGRLVMGSDWPISSANPLEAIQVAVTRVDPDDPAEPFLPEQAIPLAQAMDSYTRGSSWINGGGSLAGNLEVGAPADLVVLDRDPAAGPPEQIRDAQVLATYVGGTRVHEHVSAWE